MPTFNMYILSFVFLNLLIPRPPRSPLIDTLFPCTTLFRSLVTADGRDALEAVGFGVVVREGALPAVRLHWLDILRPLARARGIFPFGLGRDAPARPFGIGDHIDRKSTSLNSSH